MFWIYQFIGLDKIFSKPLRHMDKILRNYGNRTGGSWGAALRENGTSFLIHTVVCISLYVYYAAGFS